MTQKINSPTNYVMPAADIRPAHVNLRTSVAYKKQKCFYFRIGTDPTDTANLFNSRVSRITAHYIYLENDLVFDKISRRSTDNQYEIYAIIRRVTDGTNAKR